MRLEGIEHLEAGDLVSVYVAPSTFSCLRVLYFGIHWGPSIVLIDPRRMQYHKRFLADVERIERIAKFSEAVDLPV